MKDFNRIRLNIPRIVSGNLAEEALGRFTRRPLLFPAAAVFISCILTYLTESFVPLAVISGILLLFGTFALVKRNMAMFFGILMSLILVISCNIRILRSLGAVMPDPADGNYIGTVISVERKLSGTKRITAIIGGVSSELGFDSDSGDIELRPGSGFIASGRFKEPDGPGTPGAFDYREYLKSKGIKYMFYADSLTVTDEAAFPLCLLLSFNEKCFSIRSRLFEKVTAGRSEEEKSLFAAVCLGDSSMASDELIRDFRLSGCSHLLAVSGTHFAGFLIALPYILAAICPDRKKSILIYMFFALAIACMTGWSESVTRAVIMSSCAFAGRDSVSAMSFSAIVMIFADPFCSCRSGFLLSFAACISIKLLSGRIRELLGFLKEKKGLVTALAVQTAALMGTMPFSNMTQSRCGIVQFITQAVGGLLAKNVCVMFIPGVLLSLVLPESASYIVSSPAAFFLDLLRKAVLMGSRYSLIMAGKPAGTLIVFCIWLFLFVRLMPSSAFRKCFHKISYILLAVCFGSAMAGVIKPVKAEVVFADVGQGDCCLIIAGNTTCLIDGGTYEKGSSEVAGLLDYYGIDSVDIAFMTHWDQDHAGGIAFLNQSGRVNQIYTGFTGNDGDTEAFEKSLKYRGSDPGSFRSNILKTRSGDVFEMSGDVRLKVIYPENCQTGGNHGSLVLALECCGKEILFTGDIGLETEDELVSSDTVHDIDVLKVSHHGSRYASGKGFLDKVRPEMSVISAGKNNLYGHPSPVTVRRLEDTGTRIFRIDQEGAVILEFY